MYYTDNQPAPKPAAATPACDRINAIGQWNIAWDPFYQLDPVWTDEFMATGAGIYGSGVMSAKDTELLSVAFDASYTHMYAPGTRRHIHNALEDGATNGRDHGGIEAVRRAGRTSVQSRCTDFSQGAGEPAAIRVMLDIRDEMGLALCKRLLDLSTNCEHMEEITWIHQSQP